ncbi:hypothetical protein KUCAC02_013350 [Chaenocephalus aceratus]|nr:hypothetical protein KUCAC02_013350 [Chaenocephalus aceratus]
MRGDRIGRFTRPLQWSGGPQPERTAAGDREEEEMKGTNQPESRAIEKQRLKTLEGTILPTGTPTQQGAQSSTETRVPIRQAGVTGSNRPAPEPLCLSFH